MAETQTKPSARGETGFVTVACKLPHGLHLQLWKPGPLKGPQGENVMIKDGPRVTIKGRSSLRRFIPNSGYTPEDPSLAGGYALTENVPADFFAAWMEQNKDHPAVVNGLIFSGTAPADIAAEGQLNESVTSGTEPLDPEAPAPGIEKAEG